MIFKRLTLVGLISLTSLMISGCDEFMDPEDWIENTPTLRNRAENRVHSIPYRTIEHQAFKDYFVTIGKMALDAKKDEDVREELNSELEEVDFQSLCSKILMKRSDWSVVAQNCVRNNFFLCSEEVRAYPDMVRVLRAQLVPELRAKFDQSNACREAM